MLIGVSQVKAIKMTGIIKIIIIFKTIFTIRLFYPYLKILMPRINRLPANAGNTRLISQMPVDAA